MLKWLKDTEIKTQSSSFSSGLFRIFPSRVYLLQTYASCFAISWALICWRHCPLLSVHRWLIAAALHPAKRGLSQLRAPIWTGLSGSISMWALCQLFQDVPGLMSLIQHHTVWISSGNSNRCFQGCKVQVRQTWALKKHYLGFGMARILSNCKEML